MIIYDKNVIYLFRDFNCMQFIILSICMCSGVILFNNNYFVLQGISYGV